MKAYQVYSIVSFLLWVLLCQFHLFWLWLGQLDVTTISHDLTVNLSLTIGCRPGSALERTDGFSRRTTRIFYDGYLTDTTLLMNVSRGFAALFPFLSFNMFTATIIANIFRPELSYAIVLNRIAIKLYNPATFFQLFHFDLIAFFLR